MERTHREAESRFVEPFTPAERAQFVTLLRKLLHR
jgi:hypothetical protein